MTVEPWDEGDLTFPGARGDPGGYQGAVQASENEAGAICQPLLLLRKLRSRMMGAPTFSTKWWNGSPEGWSLSWD